MEPLVLHTAGRPGWIEVICGSMFSGKTEELIRRLKRAKIARQHVEIFKPSVEVRYSEESVVSHDENAILSTPVDTASQIMLLVGRADVVGIDEGQFFDPDLIDVCQKLASSGKRVIVAGLDQDYLGRPFEPIPQLMAVAEHVTKLHAVCMVCGAPANHSQRITPGDKRVMIGAASAYEPRCRFCFDPASSASGAGDGQADAHATTNTGNSSAAAESDALAGDGLASDGVAGDEQASDGAPTHGSAEGPDGRVTSVTRTDD